MTLTIELPDETAERVTAIAAASGLDLGAYAVAVMSEAAEADEAVDADLIDALREGIEDAGAGRVYTLDEVQQHIETALR